jgi:O-antigen ligase
MPVVLLVVVAIVMVIVVFKYPQVALALFLLASYMKSLLMLKFGFFRAVDVTVLTAVLLLLAMGYHFIRSGGSLKDILNMPVLLYSLLAVLLLLATTYTSSPDYGSSKSARFATLTFIAFLAPILFTRNLKDIKLTIWIIAFVGAIFCVGTIIAPESSVLQEDIGRGGFMETNALTTATQISTASIIAFVFVITVYTSVPLRIASLIFILLSIIGVIRTGSRGPFVGLVLVWLAGILACRKGTSKTWLPLIIAIIYITMVVSFIKLPEAVVQRITRMWGGAEIAKESAQSRTVLFSWTIQRFFERPIFGHGTGAYAVDYTGVDVRAYPHNMILELLYEQGLVGAVVLSMFLWLIFRRWRRASKSVQLYGLGIDVFRTVHIAGLMFLFTFLQAMKSGDIDGNRFMFLCAGMVVAAYSVVRRIVEEISLENEIMPTDQRELEGVEFQDAEILY